jgi:heme/copper-type cytochrome/quinol oxidase subunit 3
MDAGTLAMPRRPLRPAPAPAPAAPVISNTRLAMMIVIGTETMLFAGLIGTFLVFRLAAPAWPPPGQARLPLAVTWANTAVLLGSILPMTAALRAVRRDDQAALARALVVTALLGTVFLGVQGFEWARLLRQGLTLASGTYGATFYVLIGCHAAHVLIAVAWLVATTLFAMLGRFSAARHAALEMCGMYWYFVCGLWMILFPLVYLA